MCLQPESKFPTIMSAVSALINRFNSPGGSPSNSPPATPRTTSSYVGRRHYSTGSAGSSRSASPASVDSFPDTGTGSLAQEDERARLGSITENKIRMFDSRSSRSSRSSEGTDGGGRSTTVAKRGALRQTSCIGLEGERGKGAGKVDGRVGLKARRQMSAPAPGQKGRTPFCLPGMGSCKFT